jgi:hypothetical protein
VLADVADDDFVRLILDLRPFEFVRHLQPFVGRRSRGGSATFC